MNVGVAQAGSFDPVAVGEPPVISVYPALLDTGASITCISAKVAKEVGLIPIGKRPMASTTDHSREMNTYLVDLGLPFGEPKPGVPMATQSNVNVMEFDNRARTFEILLGRDVLCLGLFNMVGYDKRFTFCL